MPGCKNLILEFHSTDTKLWYSNIHYINESRQSLRHTQVSNFKSTQRAMQVGCFFSPLATVSRAYWVQKACAAYCLIIKASQMFTLLSHEEPQHRQIKVTHLTVHAGIAAPLSVLWTVVPKQAHHQLPCGESYHFSLSVCCSSQYKWPSRQLIPVFLFRERVLLPL